ncbi:MAG TPA: HAD-IIB family hydrolase [Candidatus Paceibacterota bacterium]|nr:HAD-IIB family hydrolase [Candidatus Paceibacterota bacterium]
MSLPKVVAFDLDGTLAVSKSQVSPEMGTLLAELTKKLPVAIMSGGKYAQFQKQVLTALPEDAHLENLYLFPVCAGYCYHFVDGEWKLVDDNSYTPEEKAVIMAALEESMAETGFTEPPTPVWGERIEDRGALIAFSGLGQEAPWEAKKEWDPHKEKRRPLWAALVARLPDCEVKMNAATTIDITRKGITKAYGVRKLSEFTGVPISEMLYVGDALFPGGNDEVVIPTGIPTRPIADTNETAAVIKEILAQV